MSGDEGLVTLIATILGPGAWAFAILRAGAIDTLRPGRWPVYTLAWTLSGLGALIFAILRFCAADDVREAPLYLYMYLVLGLAWLRVCSWCFPVLGLNSRDDIVERRNHAAAIAWAGAMVATALCYSGGNVGNGPGWWVVVFSAGLATAALFAVWLALAIGGGLGDTVGIDRDRAAGIRLAGALVAAGLVFGSAVTGDWISADATVADFVSRSWPALLVTVAALGAESVFRPKPGRTQASLLQAGVVPAVAYLLLAAICLHWVQPR